VRNGNRGVRVACLGGYNRVGNPLKRIVLIALVLSCAGAYAQLRTLPQDAPRGVIRHVQEMIVEINGTQRPLVQGAQIRDRQNRIVVPTAIPPGTLVKYVLDKDGAVLQVWFLTSEEAQGN
jgi:hypothetical protein